MSLIKWASKKNKQDLDVNFVEQENYVLSLTSKILLVVCKASLKKHLYFVMKKMLKVIKWLEQWKLLVYFELESWC